MFNKIVVVEPIFIKKDCVDELKKYCKKLEVYDTPANGEKEIIKRINDADCILVSTNTLINKTVINNCLNIKHVELCCSYFGKEYSKVDIDALEGKDITYSYLSEYGDNGVVEYTVAQTINLIQGLNGKMLKPIPYDLTGIKIGIIGLGNLGYKIAKAFRLFETDLYYYSRTRKEKIEQELGIKYLNLDKLLKTVDIISINVNRDVCLIGGEKLSDFNNNKAIINTSIGKCYEIESLKKWLDNKSNYYICDKPSINEKDIKKIINYDNVIYTDQHSGGSTKQCLERATKQIIDNLKKALANINKSNE